MNRKSLLLASVSCLMALSACTDDHYIYVAPDYPQFDQINNPPPPPPNSVYTTEEFRRNYGLNSINAIPAYEAGLSGAGVTVAVIDTGIALNHEDLDANIHPASIDIIAGRAVPSVDDVDGHGTMVAGVIAAEKNDIGAHGVAFNAQILAIRTDSEGSCATVDGCHFHDNEIADAIDYAIANGVKIINLSLGGGWPSWELHDAFFRAFEAGIMFVISAGNDSAYDPTPFAQFVNHPGAEENIIVVGAVDQDNNLASFTNLAGATQNAYVLAPGVGILSTYLNNGYARGSGTSLSAAHVSGAAAILAEMFPNLTGPEIIDILLATAVDFGPTGIDPYYGAGLIDLGAAIQPIGTAMIVTMSLGTDAATPLLGSGIQTTMAFGDALYDIGALGQVMMLDDFRRSYFVDLSDQVRPRALSGYDLDDMFDQYRSRQSFDLSLAPNSRVSFAFTDEGFDRRAIIDALPMAERTQMTYSRPSAFFSGQLNARTQMAAAYGMDAGRLLDRASGRGRYSDAFFNGGLASGLAQFGGGRRASSMGFSYSLSDDTELSFAVSSENLSARFDAWPERQTADARSVTAMARLSTPLGPLDLNIDGGTMAEWGAVLGSPSNGALRLGQGARTVFAGLGAGADLPAGFRLEAAFSTGLTMVDGTTGSLVDGISDFRSMSFGAALFRDKLFSPRDRLGLAVAQPLRVEGGQLDLLLPTGRDYGADRILFSETRIPLSPSRREVDIELSYRYAPDASTSVTANVLQRFNAGHSGLVGNELTFLVRGVRRF